MSEIANSSLDTAVQENTTCGSSNIYTSIRPFNRYHSISSTYSSEDPEKPPVRPMVDENSAAGKAGVNARTGFTRVTARISALKSFDVYGTDGFGI
jgi:hypothetical protein